MNMESHASNTGIHLSKTPRRSEALGEIAQWIPKRRVHPLSRDFDASDLDGVFLRRSRQIKSWSQTPGENQIVAQGGGRDG